MPRISHKCSCGVKVDDNHTYSRASSIKYSSILLAQVALLAAAPQPDLRRFCGPAMQASPLYASGFHLQSRRPGGFVWRLTPAAAALPRPAGGCRTRGDLALYEGLACAREKGKRVLENLEEARQGARQAKAAKRYTEA